MVVNRVTSHQTYTPCGRCYCNTVHEVYSSTW